MLSIGRLGTTGGADYYLDKVANSVDDYYLGRGEASYNQNLWMHHLTGGATYLPL
jgi:hypothetical protein